MTAVWQGTGRDSTRFGERLLALGLLAVVIFLGRSVWNVYQKNQTSRLLRDEAATELAAVAERYAELEARVKRLETPRGQEEEVRKSFSVARSGERVVVIKDEETLSPPTIKKRPNWWWKYWPFNR
jgi:cell division protein FtsB